MRGQNNVLIKVRKRQLMSVIASKSISKVFFLFTVCGRCSGFVLKRKLMCGEDGAFAHIYFCTWSVSWFVHYPVFEYSTRMNASQMTYTTLQM